MKNNDIFSLISPQMQNNLRSLHMQALQSGNPQQFLMQKFQGDPLFQEGMKIFNEQGIQGLNNFIASKLK